MDTAKIVAEARQAAARAREMERRNVRLPVMNFTEWAALYGRHDNLAAREEHRFVQKRNFYFKRFLETEKIEVTMVACRAEAVAEWADNEGHPFFSDSDKTHVLAHYVSQPDLPPAQCVHKRPLTADLAAAGLELFATMTVYGERPDLPEILSTVVHTRDGWVVESLEVLAAECGGDEAFDKAGSFMQRHGVKHAFQDPNVRRPEFCADCGELLVNTASEAEYGQIKR